MMAMLIRTGLPLQRQAMSAIVYAKPVFDTPVEMRARHESDEVTACKVTDDWPTSDTAALRARY